MSKARRPSARNDLHEENRILADNLQLLQERFAELELALEDTDWIRLAVESDREFSRGGLQKIIALARLMWIKNPLVNRAVNVQSQYVWAQGISIQATDQAVNAVVQAFLDDPDNQAELTSHQSRTLKEVGLQVEGNIFFVFFTDRATGAVRLRTIPVDQVADIITNPDDRRDVWLYERQYTENRFVLTTGTYAAAARTGYYPDLRFAARATERPDAIGGHPVYWDTPVYHVRVGGLADMRFGVPEVYQAIDWARAYNSFLEDRATLARALSRFAWSVKTPGGAKGVSAAKTALATTLGATTAEGNPPPIPGSTFITTPGGASLDPIRLSGATIHPDEGRRFLLMVCSAVGLPETFMGDVSTGNLATAKSLDRPTQLKFQDRRMLWSDILQTILQYVIDAAIAARRLSPTVDRHVDVTFPDLLEEDVTARVGAIVDAATLRGQPTAGTMDARTLSRLLLTALGVDQIDDLLDRLVPEDDAPAPREAGDRTVPADATALMVEAVRELRASLASILTGVPA